MANRYSTTAFLIGLTAVAACSNTVDTPIVQKSSTAVSVLAAPQTGGSASILDSVAATARELILPTPPAVTSAPSVEGDRRLCVSYSSTGEKLAEADCEQAGPAPTVVKVDEEQPKTPGPLSSLLAFGYRL